MNAIEKTVETIIEALHGPNRVTVLSRHVQAGPRNLPSLRIVGDGVQVYTAQDSDGAFAYQDDLIEHLKAWDLSAEAGPCEGVVTVTVSASEATR